MAKTFEELVEDANKQGFYILNAYQTHAAHWRVNMQKRTNNGATETIFTAFADGKTASEALKASIFNLKNATPSHQLGTGDRSKDPVVRPQAPIFGRKMPGGDGIPGVPAEDARPAGPGPGTPIPRARPGQAIPAPVQPATNAIPRLRVRPAPEPAPKGLLE